MRVEGFLCTWGTNSKNITFTPQTDFEVDMRKPVQIPIYYQHWRDNYIKSARLGYITHLEKHKMGLFGSGYLSDSPHKNAIVALLKAGVLSWSISSLKFAKDTTTKTVSQWPIQEATLTPIPADADADAWLQNSHRIAMPPLTSSQKSFVDEQMRLRQQLSEKPRLQPVTVASDARFERALKALDRLIPAPAMHSLPIKDGRAPVLGGYLIAYGNPNNRDLQGEYFWQGTWYDLPTKSTHAYKTLPMLWNHGFDEFIGKSPIGEWHLWEFDNKGMWAEGRLDPKHRQFRNFVKLVQTGLVGLSSGAAHGQSERDINGRITRWPVREGSLTPTAANPESGAVFLKKF